MTSPEVRMKWLRAFFIVVGLADLALGIWLLFFPGQFASVMQLTPGGEPIFIRESGSYMAFAALLCMMAAHDPKGNVAVAQSTIVYRGLACIIEIISVVALLRPGVFHTIFTICACLDGSLAIATILLLRWVGLPWVPFRRAS